MISNKNIAIFSLGALLIFLSVMIYIIVTRQENYDSAEHTIAGNGCINLKNNFSNKFSKLDKCGNLNSECIVDPLIFERSCATNLYILHNSKDIDKNVDIIWAITNVAVIDKYKWLINLENYKLDGWVACGEDQGTIPGIYPTPQNTGLNPTPFSTYLCVKYEKVNINSDIKILTSIYASEFKDGKSTCINKEVPILGDLTFGDPTKKIIGGGGGYTLRKGRPCNTIGGCTTYESVNKCNKYIDSILLKITKQTQKPEINRYAISRNIEPGSSYTGVILSFADKKVKAKDWRYKTNNANSPLLSFGEILALAGDIYGIPDQPITPIRTAPNLYAEKGRFINSFNTLNNNKTEELVKVLEILKVSIQNVNDYLLDGKLVSDYFKKLDIADDVAYNNATGGENDVIPKYFEDKGVGLAVYKGRYIKLAQNNYDHFCEKNHAYRSYMAGHTIAMEYASRAKSQTRGDSYLHLAYAIEAFACHFLSDHFSSGHIRVPREDLHLGRNCSWWNTEYIWNSTLGDYCSKLMHDEDNKLGLFVANNACYVDNPDPKICKVWKAYGDSYMTDPQNQENLIRQQEVLQISADEVWNSYVNSTVVDSKVWLYLPCIDEKAKIPKLDIENKIIGYYPNNDIYNDSKNPVKIGEYSSLNYTPMFLAPDPNIYGSEYNCVYKRVDENKMTYVFSPAKAAYDMPSHGAYFPGVTH